jgi:hypothetical protein
VRLDAVLFVMPDRESIKVALAEGFGITIIAKRWLAKENDFNSRCARSKIVDTSRRDVPRGQTSLPSRENFSAFFA